MEDEARPLPPGWLRQYDANESHQFFVDTNADPPRSIWHHPHDDEQYLSTISSEERETLQAAAAQSDQGSINAESSADETEPTSPAKDKKAKSRPTSTASTKSSSNSKTNNNNISSSTSTNLPPRPSDQERGLGKLGRRVKDRITSSTHADRERDRDRRAAEEAEAYARYQHFRTVMTKAAQTNEPQLLGKNDAGQDVYLEPPRTDIYGHRTAFPGAGYQGQGGLGGGGGGGGGSGLFGPGGRAIDPNAQGPYANPQNQFETELAVCAAPWARVRWWDGHAFGGRTVGRDDVGWTFVLGSGFLFSSAMVMLMLMLMLMV
jgi:hypothetical protein